MSDNTRDWLLKKLLKADRTIVAQREEIAQVQSAYAVDTQNFARRLQEANASREELRQRLTGDINELIQRIQSLAPEKQFEIQYKHGRVSQPLEITSVSSCNGKTTITVR